MHNVIETIGLKPRDVLFQRTLTSRKVNSIAGGAVVHMIPSGCTSYFECGVPASLRSSVCTVDNESPLLSSFSLVVALIMYTSFFNWNHYNGATR
jgi:hypothetical protein